MAKHGETRAAVAWRARYSKTRIKAGSLRDAFMMLPAAARDGLEARCAKTGETIAEALAAFWGENA